MSELKPCPFCGADVEVTDHENFKIAGCSNLSMLCPNPAMTIYNDDFSYWNSRVQTETEKRLATDRNNAISLMSPSWKHAASKEPDLMTRYVTMAKNQFKKKNEEIERLAAMATKHATRADELCEALECICSRLSEDGVITAGLAKEIVNAQAMLRKRTVRDSNDDWRVIRALYQINQ